MHILDYLLCGDFESCTRLLSRLSATTNERTGMSPVTKLLARNMFNGWIFVDGRKRRLKGSAVPRSLFFRNAFFRNHSSYAHMPHGLILDIDQPVVRRARTFSPSWHDAPERKRSASNGRIEDHHGSKEQRQEQDGSGECWY
jgi:hypothetical protein